MAMALNTISIFKQQPAQAQAPVQTVQPQPAQQTPAQPAVKKGPSFLEDTFEEVGCDSDKLDALLMQLSNMALLEHPLHDLQFITYCNMDKNGDMIVACHGDGKFQSFVTGDMREGDPKYMKIPKAILERHGILQKDYFREFTEKSGTLLYVDKQLFFISQKNFWLTFTQRLGMPGSARIRHSDQYSVRKARDNMYTMCCSMEDNPVKLLMRQDGNSKKIFAGFSAKYSLVPQKDVYEMTQEKFEGTFNKAQLVSYRIDNSFTEITLCFPDCELSQEFTVATGKPDTFIPAVRIRMSDVGLSSVIFNAGFMVPTRNSRIMLLGNRENGWYSRQHNGDASAFKIVDKADELLFKSYKQLIDRLGELVAITIPGIQVHDILHEVVKKTGIMSCRQLPKGEIKHAVKTLENEFNASIDVTAYDLFMAVCEIPEILKVDDTWSTPEYRDTIRRMVLESAFVDYQGLVQ